MDKKEMNTALNEFQKLLEIMEKLRNECPWDKAQTFESLRHLTIEETYELADAILDKDFLSLKKELGDLLLHIVFYACVASEQQLFDIKDVIQSINEKLIRRHPHIFSDVTANDAETVKSNWEKIKLQEGKKSVLEGVPNSLPSMIKAYRIQDKVKGVGFDWEKPEQVWEKVQEELQELQVEVSKNQSKKKIEQEFGDLIFALINYARFIDINPDTALERTNQKFIKRFKYLERKALESGKTLSEMSLAEMDVFWEEAKKEEDL